MDKDPKLKFRYVYFGIGLLLALIALVVTEADANFFGSVFAPSTVMFVIYLLRTVLVVGAYHFALKAFFDYINYEEWLKVIWQKRDPMAMAVVFVGLSIFGLSLSLIVGIALLI